MTFQKEGRGHRAQCWRLWTTPDHGHVEERREVGFAWAGSCCSNLDTGSGGDRGKQLADTGASFLQMEPTLLTQTDFLHGGGRASVCPSILRMLTVLDPVHMASGGLRIASLPERGALGRREAWAAVVKVTREEDLAGMSHT